MMNPNISEILKRQLLLMGYKSKDTLSENVDRINNQTLLNEQGSADMRDEYYGSEEYIQQHDIQMSDKIARTYPNYCWNNGEGTVVPGKNEHGLSGVEAIPIDTTGGTVFCAYRGAGNKLLFLPTDVQDIYFMKGDIEEYDSIIKHAVKTDNPDPVKPEYMKIFSEYITSVHLKDSVFEFTLSNGLNFTPRRQRILAGGSGNNKNMHYKFLGYFNKESNSYYENPIWKDDRNEYQKFVDDWGTWIQIGAAVVTAILGTVTGGGTWVITAEILVEMGLGIWVAQREFERGDNIAAVASVVFGLLPMLKLTKWFPGVSDDVFKSLSKQFAESGLEATDDVADYVLFYNKLSEEEQMLLSKLLKQDDVNRSKMFKEIAEELGKLSTGKIDDGLKAMIKANPKILKDISFFNRLWVRELGANAGVIVVTIALELCCSKSLNNEEKMKLSKVYSVIPESTQKLLAYNLVNNTEVFDEALNNMSQKTFEENFDVDKGVKSIAEWAEKNVKESVEEAGGTFLIIDDPESDTSDDKEIEMNGTISQSQLDSLKNDGWMTMNEFLDTGLPYDDKISDPVSYTVDGKEVFLVKKN